MPPEAFRAAYRRSRVSIADVSLDGRSPFAIVASISVVTVQVNQRNAKKPVSERLRVLKAGQDYL